MPDTNPRTIGRWIDLPTSGGADDRLRADQPLGSGTMQILASNAAWASRRNSLRTLWECPGVTDNSGTLGFGTTAGTGTRVDEFDWYANQFTAGNVAVWCAGLHRVRPYGDTGRSPNAVLTARGMAGGTSTTGLILLVRDRPGRPESGDIYALATTTSNTMTRMTATIESQYIRPGSRLIAPLDETVTPSPPSHESGRDEVLYFWIGVYTDGAGGGKATVRGLTLYLDTPSP